MKKKRYLLTGVGLIIAFVLWTVLILSRFERSVRNRHRLVTGLVLTTLGGAVFILTRQPYAGIMYLAILVIKGLLIGKGRNLL